MNDQILDLEFPAKGIAVDAPVGEQQGGTTRLGKNVRFHEVLTNRGRGGSRAGIERFIDEQVNGTAEIQHLNTVVRTDGNALAWNFEGNDFQFDGLYLGVDLISPGPGDDQPTGGGGGYQPSASFKDNRVRLSLAISHTTRNIANQVTITATVTDEDGNPVTGRRLRLFTSPGGRDGDKMTAASSWTVQNDRAEEVTYIAIVEDALGKPETHSRNTVKCDWVNPTQLILLVRFQGPVHGAPFDAVTIVAKMNGATVMGRTFSGDINDATWNLWRASDSGLVFSNDWWPSGVFTFDQEPVPLDNFVSGSNTLRFQNEGGDPAAFSGLFSLVSTDDDGVVVERLYEAETVIALAGGAFVDFPFTF